MSRALKKTDIDDVIKELEEAGYHVQLAEAGQPYIEKAFKKVGQAAGGQIVDGFAFDLEQKEAVKEISKITGDFSKTTRKTALKEVKKALTTALEEGQTIAEAQKIMRDLYAKKWRSRADMIARDQIMTASSGGSVESYRQIVNTTSGIKIRKIWIASGDACPWCVALHGETVAIEENFIDKGGDAKYVDDDGETRTYKCDYRAIGYPTLHPNGRCTVGAEVVFS
jgi:F like protein